MTNSEKFKPGTRIYYTGDMANNPTEGTITKYIAPEKNIHESAETTYDNPRFEGDTKKDAHVLILEFNPGPGRRFWLLDDYLAVRAKCLQQLEQKISEVSHVNR